MHIHIQKQLVLILNITLHNVSPAFGLFVMSVCGIPAVMCIKFNLCTCLKQIIQYVHMNVYSIVYSYAYIRHATSDFIMVMLKSCQ